MKLSYAQRGMWLAQKMHPRSSAFNIYSAARCTLPFDAEVALAAVAGLQKAHTALRTVVIESDGEPQRRVLEGGPWAGGHTPHADVVDAREWSVDRLHQDIYEHGAAAFDLACGPLFRVRFYREQVGYAVSIAAHHVAIDVHSVALMHREIALRMQALFAGHEAPQLASDDDVFVAWEQEVVQGRRGERDLKFWRQTLTQLPPPLRLPVDRHGRRGGGSSSQLHRVSLPESTVTALRAWAASNHGTLYTVLATITGEWLSFLHGHESLVVGTTFSQRRRADLRALIGPLTNAVPLSLRFQRGLSFAEHHATVAERVRRTLHHSAAPYDWVSAQLREQHGARQEYEGEAAFDDLRIDALTSVLFNFFETSFDDDPGEPLLWGQASVTYDLSITAYAMGCGLNFNFNYDAERIDAEHVAAWADALTRLVEYVTTHANEPLRQAAMAMRSKVPNGQADRGGPLRASGERRAQQAGTAETSFGAVFDASAQTYGQRIAVSGAGGTSTFAQLQRHVTAIAALLDAVKVGAGQVVAVSSGPGVAQIAATVAVMRSGGVVLLLDPEEAWFLTLEVVRQAKVAHVLLEHDVEHDGDAARQNFEGAGCEVVVFDLAERARELPTTHESAPEGGLSGSDAAYVMFTSGSTGMAKAAVVSHAGMLNHHRAKIAVASLSEHDVVLQSAPCGFVISMWQMLAALQVGGRVHVLTPAGRHDLDLMLDEVVAAKVTVMQLVPSVLAALLASSRVDDLRGLRLMLSTGEALSPALARLWFARFPEIPWVNCYGATETSDDICHAMLTAAPPVDVARVRIGDAIEGAVVSVRDEDGDEVPWGFPGEICVDGVAVASDLNGASLGELLGEIRTSRAVDATSNRYHTGDRGRRRFDGSFELLGRLDQQVKVRGQRVDLEHVEALLCELEFVQVAAAREYDGRLLTYVVRNPQVSHTDFAVDAARAVEHLTSRLAKAIAPNHCVALAVLPKGRTGKLDRTALPLPGVSGPDEAAQHTDETGDARGIVHGPGSVERERALRRIWSDVLGRDVSAHDPSFFALGGHSLKWMTLLHRVRTELGVELSSCDVDAIDSFAKMFERVSSEPAASDRVRSISPTARGAAATSEKVPLSSLQQRFWVMEHLAVGPSMLNVAGAVRLRGRLHVSALRRGLHLLAARHDALRMRFRVFAGKPYQDAPADSVPELELHNFVGGTEAELQRYVDEACLHSFALDKAPLVRVRLVVIGQHDHLLILAAHHLVCDGGSIDVLIQEWLAVYDAEVGGKPSALGPAPMQALEYARWESQQANFASQQAFFEQDLGGVQPFELPRARRASEGLRTVMKHAGVRVDEDLRARVSAAAAQFGVTPFRLLLASLCAVVARATGSHTGCLGVTHSRRHAPGRLRSVGLLLNTVPLRVDLSGDPTLREAVTRLDKCATTALAHGDIPFEHLLESIDGLAPTLVTLTFHERDDGAWTLPELDLERFPTQAQSPASGAAFYVEQRSHTLDVRVAYDSQQYDAIQAQQWLAQWVAALDAMSTTDITGTSGKAIHLSTLVLPGPAAALGEKHALRAMPESDSARGEQQSHQLLPQSDSPQSAGEVLHEAESLCTRFMTIATLQARNPALSTPGGVMSYGQLASLSESLALRLCSLFAGQGGNSADAPVRPRVAILCHNDSVNLGVALWGVLRAGMVCVPLDASHPETRMKHVMADAGVEALVFDADLEACAQRIREEAALEPVLAAGPVSGTLPHPNAADVAYLMYTSGSTGLPKGVVQNHRNVAHFAQAYANSLGGVTPDARIGLLSNIAHDAGLMDFFVATLHGACLYPADVRRWGMPRTIEWIEQGALTVLHMTPTFFRSWMSAVSRATSALADGSQAGARSRGAARSQIRAVVFDGEPSSRDDVNLFWAQFAEGCRLVNCYGSTESSMSMHSVLVRDGQGTSDSRKTLPAGPCFALAAPVARTSVQLRTPVGPQSAWYGEGDVVVCSDFVSPGYWNRQELTREVFRAAAQGGERAYWSGDLGRWLPGEHRWIEVTGRRDRQIKILGQRVELREIEASLRQCLAVGEVAVVYRALRPGHYRLEAMAVEEAGQHEDKPRPTIASARASLLQTLPDHMVPQRLHWLSEMPRTANGKADEQRLECFAMEAQECEEDAHDSPGEIAAELPLKKELRQHWAAVLGVPVVHDTLSFFAQGGDSLQLLELQHRLSTAGHAIEVVELFEHSTLNALTDFLSEATVYAQRTPRAKRRTKPVDEQGHIAVVGWGLRLPSAVNSEELWSMLQSGADGVSDFSADELANAGVDRELLDHPAYVRRKGVLGNLRTMDTHLFALSDREARLVGPQQRLLLECAWEALEMGAIVRDEPDIRGAVYVASDMSRYLLNNLMPHAQSLSFAERDTLIEQALFGNGKDHAALRMAHFLGTTGPAMAVGSACSGGLLALHCGTEALLRQECDFALVGAASVEVPHRTGYMYQAGGRRSKDGHTLPFSRAGTGVVPASGVVVLALMRMQDAQAERRPVLGRILGTAANHDVREKQSYAAPTVDGQATVIAEALAAADVSGHELGAIEAQASCTAIADALEVQALQRALGGHAADSGPCALGSIKATIGHTGAAAGLAGVMRALLMLHHGQVPAMPGSRPWQAVHGVDFGRFAPDYRGDGWPLAGARVAGCSAFGVGGSNVHAVLGDDVKPNFATPSETGFSSTHASSAQVLVGHPSSSHDKAPVARGPYRLPVSAASADALEQRCQQVRQLLVAQGAHAVSLAGLEATLQHGRTHLAHRRAIVCADAAEAVRLWDDSSAGAASADGDALLRAWLKGESIAWPESAAPWAPIPSYPFERREYWVEASPPPVAPPAAVDPSGDAGTVLGGESARPVQQALREVVGALVGRAPELMTDDTELASLGMDSFLGAEAIERLRVEFGVSLDIRELRQAKTLRDLIRSVESAPPATVGAAAKPAYEFELVTEEAAFSALHAEMVRLPVSELGTLEPLLYQAEPVPLLRALEAWQRKELLVMSTRVVGTMELAAVYLLQLRPAFDILGAGGVDTLNDVFVSYAYLFEGHRGRLALGAFESWFGDNSEVLAAYRGASAVPLRIVSSLRTRPAVYHKHSTVMAAALAKTPAEQGALFERFYFWNFDPSAELARLANDKRLQGRVLAAMRGQSYDGVTGEALLRLHGEFEQQGAQLLSQLVADEARVRLHDTLRRVGAGEVVFVGFDLRWLEPLFLWVGPR